MRKQKWIYEKSAEKAREALDRWEKLTHEVAQILYDERKLLAAQKGQSEDRWADNFVPTWEFFCSDVHVPRFFKQVLKGFNSLIEYVTKEKEAAKAKKLKNKLKRRRT